MSRCILQLLLHFILFVINTWRGLGVECRLWNHLFLYAAAADAKSLQSCPTLCDPRDSSPPGFRVAGILQVRTLEWVAISFSNAWKWKVKVKSLSRVGLFATPWTAAYQAPPSMGFSRQEHWSGVSSHMLEPRKMSPFTFQLLGGREREGTGRSIK